MKNNNTTTFQLSILLFFINYGIINILGYKTFLNISSKNIIISLLLGFILGYILLNIYLYIFNKINIKNYINNKIFKIIALTILSILFVYFIYKLTIFIQYIYLNKSSLIFIIITLLFLFLYTSSINSVILSRSLEILFYILLLLFLFKTISLTSLVDTNYLLPIISNNYFNILKSSLLFGFIFSSSLLLIYTFYNKEINNKKIKHYLTTSFLVAFIMIIINFILIISIMGINLATIYEYPEVMMLKNIKYFNFIERIDYLLSFEYLISIYALLSIILLNIKKIMNSFKSKLVSKNFYLFIILLFIISIIIC